MGRKMRRSLHRRYSSVTLTCYEHADQIVVLDCNLKRIAYVAKSKAFQATKDQIASREHARVWSLAANGWMGANHNKRTRVSQSQWERKASNWLQSIRHRRNRTRPSRIRKTDREYVRFSRVSWNHALDCMEYQHKNRTYKERARRSNPWLVWAETVSGNLRVRSTSP